MHTLPNVEIMNIKVFNALKSLEANGGIGLDTGYPTPLKESEMLSLLTISFNRPLQNGTVPNDHKVASITPILKRIKTAR